MKKFIMKIFIFLGVFLIILGIRINYANSITEISNAEEAIKYYASKTKDAIYLSDIDYLTGSNMSYTKHGQIIYDGINGGGKISLKIENSTFTFDKGIWAHASSQITYDISQYNRNYFTAFVGINTTSDKGNGVTFSVYTSVDGENWGDAKFSENKAAGANATLVKVDIRGAKYLRLIASDNGSNGNDHSVYADAKLVNSIDDIYTIKSAQEYDEIIKTKFANQTEITEEFELTLLQRELVSKMGQYTFNSLYNQSERNQEAIDWLMNNINALRYYIYGGAPAGSYYNSLTQLSRLYYNYKEDFDDQRPISNQWEPNLTYGKLYTKMAITLSLTHSTRVSLWMWVTPAENQSDSVRRYAIYKYMYNNNKFKAGPNNYAPWFESLKVEEMRFIMNNSIDDESVLWLNDYVNTRIAANNGKVGSLLTPHPYIAYVWPNYTNPVYFANENITYFNELFAVNKTEANVGKEIVNANGESTGKVGLWDSEYRIPGGKENPEYSIKITRGTSSYKLAKVWMNFRNKFGTGSVCGGISKSGSNIRATHAIPATVIGQPGHAALLYYTKVADGRGSWGIDNDVSGWTQSEKGERLLLGWGNGSYRSRYNVPYMQIGQEALNDYDNLVKAEQLVKLANVYSDNLEKKEQLYREALRYQKFNLDAWLGLIDVYNKSTTKTENDYYDLAEELAEGLKNFPLPMHDLTNLIKPKLKSVENQFKFTLLQTRILTYGSKLQTSNEIVSTSLTRTMAKYLLGKVDKSIATFSFDGDNANKIVLASKFDGNGVRWDYSIDGKQTWHEVSFTGEEEHKHLLTPEEIASITSENDIYIHIVGVNYDEKNLFKIDILESAGLPATFFASDLENRLIGTNNALEWKYNENDAWVPYKASQPNLEGDKTLIVRTGATGVYLAAKTNTTLRFTENNDPETRKYIPVKHLSIAAVSTEATSNAGAAVNAIDANYNTRWHSAWNGSDTQRFITVKLDEPVYLSAVEFVPASGGNGKIYDGTIYGSMDGEKWQVLKQVKNLTYTNSADTVAQAIANTKSFDIDDPTKVQYVKIVANRTNGNWFTARAFNFYQDTTVKAVADFSFDGENAGKIVLFEEHLGKNYKYSIDGGSTWKKASEDNHKLSDEEIEQINSEDHIKVKLDGDKTEYVIKIRKGTTPALAYLNDLENRPIGLTDINKLEWKISGNTKWTSYSDDEPYVEGNKTLLVRTKATGRYQASDPTEYEFTDDNQPANMKYISIRHESIHAYSTQSIDSGRPFYAPNIIDGRPDTLWHTDFRYDVRQQEKPYVTIKLDDARYISALEFIQRKYKANDPDYIKTAKVYVSEDGEHWKEAGKIEDCPQTVELRRIEFNNSIYGQYVKLEMETYDIFASLQNVHLFEDTTKKLPEESIEYSPKNPTNKDVVATLTSDEKITITNNEGNNTHTFTENGTFTFEYTTKSGKAKTITAIVDWIDKDDPIGTIKYSVLDTDITNQDVIATLETNEPVTITNNGGKNTYTFKENGEFTFEFTDKVGNKGTATAAVSNINKKTPTARIKYSTTAITNQDVVATIEVESGVTITNNNGSKEYTFKENGSFTFEYMDTAGNKGAITARVTNIDKSTPTAKVVYSTTAPTNKNVVASLYNESENITVTNEGGRTHTFTENGTFTFEFVDRAGNKGTAVATVKNIDKTAPTAKVKYSTTNLTNKDVIATLYDESEEITITNNNGKNTYTFKDNGTFTFEFTDKAGNKGTAVAKISIIDKIPPIAKIRYSTTQPTNKEVIATLEGASEEITITNNDGKATYTFKENGTFTFEFTDKAGNKGTATAKVENIIKEAKIEVSYSTLEPTNKDVVATLKYPSNKNITITNNDGKNTYTFKENGSFTFEIIDELGNKKSIVATVKNIDKTAPTAKVILSTTELTNKDVIATLTDESEKITITNNNGERTHTFTKNGEFTFEIADEAGNKASVVATVKNIDKVAPTAKVTYSETETTKENVIVTLTDESEEITITNNNGKNTYTFTKNGTFTFEFIDKAGNKGKVKAIVNNIEKFETTAKIKYSTTAPTNKAVIATLADLEEGMKITNNNGENTYTFEDNGTFTFEFTDKDGNEGALVAIVNNIDKVAPTATIIYTPNSKTKENVIATIQNFSEDVTILNNNGKNTYTFKDNGTFTFEISDKAGNITKLEAKVTWIDKNLDIKPTPSPSHNPIPSPRPSTRPVTEPEVVTYKTYKLGKVVLKVPSNKINKDTEIKIKGIKIDSEVEKKLTGDNEYFELYIESDEPKDVTYTMTIDIDSSKKLKALYQLDSKNNLREVNYRKVGNDKIETEVNSLGKYIVTYEKEEIKLPEDDDDDNDDDTTISNREKTEDNSKSKINVPITIIIIVIALSIFFTILGIKENFKSENR